MRKIISAFIFIVFSFVAVNVFAAGQWVRAGNSHCLIDVEGNCDSYVDVCIALTAGDPWRLSPLPNDHSRKGCYRNSEPCDLPETWDQELQQCVEPNECESGPAGTHTWPSSGNLSCVGSCAVTQTGDSSCTGTPAEGGTCTASFDFTGQSCPNPGDGDGGSGGSSSSSGSGDGGDSSGGSSSSGSGDGGGDGDGDGSGDGDGGGGGSSAGSGGGGSSAGSGSGGSSAGSGGGGGGNGDGDCESGETCDGDGSFGGGTCDANNPTAPKCEGDADPIVCAVAIHTWQTECNDKLWRDDLKGTDDYRNGDSVADGNNSKNKVAVEETQFRSLVDDLNDSTFLSAGCPAPIPVRFSIMGKGMSIEFTFRWLCELAGFMRPFIIALGYFSAALILIRGIK